MMDLEQSIEQFENIQIDTIEADITEKQVINEALLSVSASNELELKFLISLCKDTKESDLDIQMVIPIEDVYSPLGYIPLTFQNCMTIKTYNPKFVLEVIQPSQHAYRIDADFLACLP